MIAQQHTLPLCAYYTSLDLVPSSDKCYLENLNLGLYSFHTKTELAISPNTAERTFDSILHILPFVIKYLELSWIQWWR